MDKIYKTRFAELGFVNAQRGLWRVVDMETGAHVGPLYRSKAELLGDFTRYAREMWGLE